MIRGPNLIAPPVRRSTLTEPRPLGSGFRPAEYNAGAWPERQLAERDEALAAAYRAANPDPALVRKMAAWQA